MQRVGILKKPVRWVRQAMWARRVPDLPLFFRNGDLDPENEGIIVRVPVIEGGMRPDDYHKGRSAIQFEWVGDGGEKLNSGVDTTLRVLKDLVSGFLRIDGGMVIGAWTFVKQGDEISIVPIENRLWIPDSL